MLTIDFNVIWLTSKNGFEGCQIVLCVNLKCGNDNWRWNEGGTERGKGGLVGYRKKRERGGGMGAKSLNLMKLGRQIYNPKPLLLPTPSAVSFSSSYFPLFFLKSLWYLL
jgi:hypothetical protein